MIAADRTLQKLELESWAIPTSCSEITVWHVRVCGTSTSICRIGLTIPRGDEALQVCSCLFTLQPLQADQHVASGQYTFTQLYSYNHSASPGFEATSTCVESRGLPP